MLEASSGPLHLSVILTTSQCSVLLLPVQGVLPCLQSVALCPIHKSICGGSVEREAVVLPVIWLFHCHPTKCAQ